MIRYDESWKEREHHLTFCGDTELGMDLECAFCQTEFEYINGMESCPHCKNDLVFGPYEW